MTGVYILTSPRKTSDPFAYVRALVKQIDDEQIRAPKTILCDGPGESVKQLQQLAPRWCVERYERPAGQFLGGNKWPYWKLLELASSSRGADAVVLEDDVELCANAVRRMVTMPVPVDVDVVQFFSAWLFTQPQAHPGLWRTPARMQGCQALKYSAESLEQLVAWTRDPEWSKYNESDVAMGLAQERIGLRIANHMPDLVQHVGDVSAVSHGMNAEAGITDPAMMAHADHTLAGRISVTWPGRAFDAMKLFARDDLYR